MSSYWALTSDTIRSMFRPRELSICTTTEVSFRLSCSSHSSFIKTTHTAAVNRQNPECKTSSHALYCIYILWFDIWRLSIDDYVPNCTEPWGSWIHHRWTTPCPPDPSWKDSLRPHPAGSQCKNSNLFSVLKLLGHLTDTVTFHVNCFQTLGRRCFILIVLTDSSFVAQQGSLLVEKLLVKLNVMRVNRKSSELNLFSIYRSHHDCILYLLEHNKLVLYFIPLDDLMLIPETVRKYLITHADFISMHLKYHVYESLAHRLNSGSAPVTEMSYFVLYSCTFLCMASFSTSSLCPSLSRDSSCLCRLAMYVFSMGSMLEEAAVCPSSSFHLVSSILFCCSRNLTCGTRRKEQPHQTDSNVFYRCRVSQRQ